MCLEVTQSLYFVTALSWLKHLDASIMSLTPRIPSSDLTVTGAALSYQTHHQRCTLMTPGGSSKRFDKKLMNLALQNKLIKII